MSESSNDDIRPEYDESLLRDGVRGKYYERYRQGTNLGVDFRQAIKVLCDPFRQWGYDLEHSDREDRWWTIGRVRGKILYVVWTVRDMVTRLISARKATADERRAYNQSLPG